MACGVMPGQRVRGRPACWHSGGPIPRLNLLERKSGRPVDLQAWPVFTLSLWLSVCGSIVCARYHTLLFKMHTVASFLLVLERKNKKEIEFFFFFFPKAQKQNGDKNNAVRCINERIVDSSNIIIPKRSWDEWQRYADNGNHKHGFNIVNPID